ncbi:MAG: 3-dehydroquinate synthase, partial [uncultured Gemmatimonadetes bacterium]
EHQAKNRGRPPGEPVRGLRDPGGVRPVRLHRQHPFQVLPRAALRRHHRRPGGRAVRRAPVTDAARRGLPGGRVRLQRRRGAEDARDVGAGVRRHDGGGAGARRGGGGVRRRRAGRSGRLRGGHLHARPSRGAASHVAAGDDRL